jgi:hypothetical protein
MFEAYSWQLHGTYQNLSLGTMVDAILGADVR